jgi:hypothetical protein
VPEGRTVAVLATSIRQSDEFTVEMLEDWQARGIAEQHAGLWRLTAAGFERYGRAILDAEMNGLAA